MKAKYTDQEFIQIVSESKTIREILIKLKITPYGGNYRHIYRKMERLGIHNSFKQKNNLDKKRLKDFSDEEIIVVVKDSTSVQMVFNKLDIRYGGSSYKAFYRDRKSVV